MNLPITTSCYHNLYADDYDRDLCTFKEKTMTALHIL